MPHGRTPFEQIALLLQGGGALGAYQAGVYEALAGGQTIGGGTRGTKKFGAPKIWCSWRASD